MPVTLPAVGSLNWGDALNDGITALSDTVDDGIVYSCTAATRPPHLEGRFIYETDTDSIYVSDGGTWQLIWVKGQNFYNLKAVASGSVSVSLTTAASGQSAVVFPVGRFATTPIITATLASASSSYIAGVGGQASTGFNAIAFHRDGSVGTATLTVNWIAMQTT